MKLLPLSLSALLAISGCSGESSSQPSKDGGTDLIDESDASNSLPADGAAADAATNQSESDRSLFRGLYFHGIAACGFQGGLASDGTYRCIPFDAITLTAFAYTDVGCTQKAVPVVNSTLSPPPPPPLVVTVPGPTCPTKVDVYRVGQPLKATAYYTKDASGVCSIHDATGSTVYEVGGLVPPDSFVSAKIVDGEKAGRLVRRYFEGEDGRQTSQGTYDTVGNFRCTFAMSADGMLRCLPSLGTISGLVYTEPTCTTVGGNNSDPCADTLFLARTSYDQCPTTATIFLAGKRLDTGYFLSSGACVKSGSTTRYEIGAEVPATQFVAVPSVLHGTDRIQWRTYDSGLSALPSFYRYYDSKLATDCSSALASDKQRRCLPTAQSDGAGAVTYGNDTCTVALGRFPGCQYYSVRSTEGTLTITRVYRRGAAHAGPVFSKASGACQPASFTGDPTAVFFEQGTEVPPGEFADMP